MNEKSTVDRYIDYINDNILPSIDYAELQKSYNMDMAYAKGILNRLHDAMIQVYGSDKLDEYDSDEGFVIIPGVVCGKENKNLCVALLELDLSSSGEHWGTSCLCNQGVVSQNNTGKDPVADKVFREIGAYDYCYTAVIPDDIHVDKSRLPDELKAVLNDFRSYKAVLRSEHEALGADEASIGKSPRDEKPSVLEEIREGTKPAKDAPASGKTGTKTKLKPKTGPEH